VHQTVVDVVVDQRLLCRGDSAFDGVELLGELYARAAGLHHAYYVPQVPFGPFEALDYVRVGLMDDMNHRV
jgi:hypothetical protein